MFTHFHNNTYGKEAKMQKTWIDVKGVARNNVRSLFFVDAPSRSEDTDRISELPIERHFLDLSETLAIF